MVPIVGTIAVGIAVKLATGLIASLAKKALAAREAAAEPKPEFTVPATPAMPNAVPAPALPFDLAGKLAADRAANAIALQSTSVMPGRAVKTSIARA